MNYYPQGVTQVGTKVMPKKSELVGVRPNQEGREYIACTGFPVDLLEYDRENEIYHQTQKPVSLLEYLILTYTQKGELVLDNTMGSGSTGVAAVNLDRNFIGIEKDAHYFEIAQRRIKDAQAQGHFNFD